VSLPGEGQYAGDRRELRRVCNLAHQEVQRITKQRDALMSICRDFDRWANGWCQQSKCCATSCAEIADRAREAMRLVAGSQTPKQETT
jgi:hypothetical protein